MALPLPAELALPDAAEDGGAEDGAAAAVALTADNLERECYGARGLCLIAICRPDATAGGCAGAKAAADVLAERYRRQRPPVNVCFFDTGAISRGRDCH